MASPSLALQGAIVTALKASSAVAALVGARVFDDVPQDAAFPYVSLGDAATVPDEADLYEGENIAFTVHAWSRGVGFPEAKAIAWAIKLALHRADLSVAGFRLLEIVLVADSVFRDPDGLTSHAALNFRAELEAS